ncbi:MAG: valine--tRNA ligase [Candidatus Bathyarchaeia archaeon]
MKVLPRKDEYIDLERKWMRLWEEKEVYRYDWEDEDRPRYSIDTPPPYPSGDFHMGNVLNWTYFDIRARYKRMQGYNVHFPQGWDCHGLPTEVAVEKAHGIHRSDIPPDEFRKLCMEWIEQYIDKMKTAVIRLGCSVDWSLEYRTMDPDYIRKIQLSFLKLYDDGYIYKGEHPINWCPRCETAIADAEVERLERMGKIYTIAFGLGEGDLLIATTRPEYLPACVAIGVNPEDEEHRHLIGGEAVLPLTGERVPIIGDEEVDTSFGTGVMMICTYGDKADVVAVARYDLPVVKLIDEKGRMTEEAGEYQGMSVDEARRAIREDLDADGLLRDVKPIKQEVGVCWRCSTPIEIVTTLQWFMKTIELTPRIVETAEEITWYPEWMSHRLIDWATSLDWDWVLSRQRVFATPVPVWYCKNCGEIRVAKSEELPVDPKVTQPEDACVCGCREWEPDRDVMDTWFDSSLTCAIHAGWPERDDWRKLFPASVHPSGQDIIRTWAYYLMVRHLALFDETPYESVLINGMVLGEDGRKMSKSLGNFVATPEVFSEYGADAARQWAAAGGSTGTDIPFRWQDVEYGYRFMRKLWNACRFASMRLEDYETEGTVEPRLLDRWITSKLERLIRDTTRAMEECEFMNAIEGARGFTWHTFCDHYLEAAKYRLYGSGEERRAAQQTLYRAVKRILKILAPIIPHLTEEIYSIMYAEGEDDSIHLSGWPEVDETLIDEVSEQQGDLVITTIGEIRKQKNRMGVSLNAPIKRLTIYYQDEGEREALENGGRDIAETLKAVELRLERGEGENPVEGEPGLSFSIALEA